MQAMSSSAASRCGTARVEQFSLSGTPVVVIDDDADPRRWRPRRLGRAHIRRRATGRGIRRGRLRGGAVVCVEVDEIHTLETALRIKSSGQTSRLSCSWPHPPWPRRSNACRARAACWTWPRWRAVLRRGLLLRPSHAIELAGIDFAVVKLVVERGRPPTTPSGAHSALAPVRSCPSATRHGDVPRVADHRSTAGPRRRLAR